MTTKLYFFVLLFLIYFIASCSMHTGFKQDKKDFFSVKADLETDPVESSGDAADDPAIWIHPTDKTKSLIIGTDKKKGLAIYNLKGKLLNFHSVGKINNVDLRYGFKLGDRVIDIVGGSDRTNKAIALFELDAEKNELVNIAARKIKVKMKFLYGFTMAYDKKNNKHYAIGVGKLGDVEQYELFDNGKGKIDARLVRFFDVGGCSEGMTVDDELGNLYIAEEGKGIWKISAYPNGGKKKELIDSLENKNLEKDLEGVTIYKKNEKEGYLIVSSQGNNSFALYDRQVPHKYFGSFKIIDGEKVDGVNDTDGIEVTCESILPDFPKGFLVVQDGKNKDGDKKLNQNFKIVSWSKISSILNLN
ncbi:MAG: phytase [Pseudomonadota bacterium]